MYDGNDKVYEEIPINKEDKRKKKEEMAVEYF
jgi:hypothetical protein